MSPFEIYDALEGIEGFEEPRDIVRIAERYPVHRIERVRTPSGEIQTVHREIWEDGRCTNSRIKKYPVNLKNT